ncbi:nitrilase-related carbon-nitrogen hydrolase [Agromyces mediolanus]|uniref:Carbon-nitrogen hydrolase n=1 Tax=Agromyces mediolanus TaxID=41986 RepID=A0A918CLU8_AGRME|nr:nitrilase-related carbon-nitrogen hydrolase [Agromyces mediolanus]GGR29838.1 carbon-nitrogen hydrolase [Agromyces mediolanus]GLJ72278.1 carbon-nitrogen hydrolase [Agromyces mediolanus]
MNRHAGTARERELRVVLAQLAAAPRDLRANAATIREVLAGHPDSELAVFPELFLCGYTGERVGELALTRDDPLLAELATACADSGTAVAFGFAERGEPDASRTDGAVHNSLAIIDAEGRLAAVYRKRLLFGAEAEAFAPGADDVLGDAAGTAIGALICFDIEFPEPARRLALAGAELLVSVAANMAPYLPDHELASRARALDNRLPHVYVNAVGEAEGLRFVGGSRAVRADGSVALELGAGEEVAEAVLTVGAAVDPAVDYLRFLR